MNEIIRICDYKIADFKNLDISEIKLLKEASKLLNDGFPSYSMLAIYNSCIHNLRRRIERFNAEVVLSLLIEKGEKNKYQPNKDELCDRWNKIEDDKLIDCACEAGIITEKIRYILHLIGWLRNHQSSSHENSENVSCDDIKAAIIILKGGFFDVPFAQPTTFVNDFIKEVKSKLLDINQKEIFMGEIEKYGEREINILSGFMLDAIVLGKDPVYTNMFDFNEVLWNKFTDERKHVYGKRLYELIILPEKDESEDKKGKDRLYQFLIKVKGFAYVPHQVISLVFKKCAEQIVRAKNTVYGWNLECEAAKGLMQLQISVPKDVFDEVFEAILSVYFGNFYGRSGAYAILSTLIFKLDDKDKIQLVKIVEKSRLINSELCFTKPLKYAREFFAELRSKMTVQSLIAEFDYEIKKIKILNEITQDK